MSRKNNLLKYQTVTSTAMTSDITSDVTNIQYLDNIGIQLNFTGNPQGTFYAEVSADYARDNEGNVTDAGNWVALSLSPNPSASGSADNIYLDLNQLSAPWIRVTYTNSFLATGSITTVADSSGSLAGAYFTIIGADGAKWAVWFKVSGSGSDPALSGYTSVEVDITTDDSANTVGAAVRTALASVTSVGTIGGSTNHATFTSIDPGVVTMADGTIPTGFTLAITNTTGVLDAFITGKMI